MLTNSQSTKAPTPAVANLVPGPTGRDRHALPGTTNKHRDRADRRRELTIVAPRPVTPDATWASAGKREARHLAALLARGEPVKRMAHGTYAKRKGLLVLTSQRVLFLRDRWNGAMAEEFHLASVSSVTLHESGGNSRVVIDCLGVVSEISHVPSAEANALVHEAQRILSYVRSPVSAPRPRLVTPESVQPGATAAPEQTEPARPVASHPDDEASLLMSHLRELAQLRRDGFLDDYEFAVAKAKLLN